MTREEIQNKLRPGTAKNHAKGREKSVFLAWQMNVQLKGVSVKLLPTVSTQKIQGLTFQSCKELPSDAVTHFA